MWEGTQQLKHEACYLHPPFLAATQGGAREKEPPHLLNLKQEVESHGHESRAHWLLALLSPGLPVQGFRAGSCMAAECSAAQLHPHCSFKPW